MWGRRLRCRDCKRCKTGDHSCLLPCHCKVILLPWSLLLNLWPNNVTTTNLLVTLMFVARFLRAQPSSRHKKMKLLWACILRQMCRTMWGTSHLYYLSSRTNTNRIMLTSALFRPKCVELYKELHTCTLWALAPTQTELCSPPRLSMRNV